MSCDVSLATLFNQTVHSSNTQHEPAHMSKNLRAHSRTCVPENESILLNGIINTRDACGGTFAFSQSENWITPHDGVPPDMSTVDQHVGRHVAGLKARSLTLPTLNIQIIWRLIICTCLSCVVTHVNLLCFLDFTVHIIFAQIFEWMPCLLYTSPSPRD